MLLWICRAEPGDNSYHQTRTQSEPIFSVQPSSFTRPGGAAVRLSWHTWHVFQLSPRDYLIHSACLSSPPSSSSHFIQQALQFAILGNKVLTAVTVKIRTSSFTTILTEGKVQLLYHSTVIRKVLQNNHTLSDTNGKYVRMTVLKVTIPVLFLKWKQCCFLQFCTAITHTLFQII